MEDGVFMINLLQLLLLELFQLWNGAGSHRIHFNGFLLHCCDQKKKIVPALLFCIFFVTAMTKVTRESFLCNFRGFCKFSNVAHSVLLFTKVGKHQGASMSQFKVWNWKWHDFGVTAV